MEAYFCRLLYDYHYWARDRLLKAAEGMTEEDYGKTYEVFTYGSMRNMFTHLMSVELNYLARWGVQPATTLSPEDVPTLEAATAKWQEIEAKVRPYIDAITDEALKDDIVTMTRQGTEFRRPMEVDLMQMINHGTQHRSEAAELLTMNDRSPGNLDFIAYWRERPQE